MAAQTTTADSAEIIEDVQTLEILEFHEKIRLVRSTNSKTIVLGHNSFRVPVDISYVQGEIRVDYKDGDVEVRSKVQGPLIWPRPQLEHVHSLRVGSSGKSIVITAERIGPISDNNASENKVKVGCDEVIDVLFVTVTLRFHPTSLSKILKASICHSDAFREQIPYVKNITEKKMSDVTIICSDQEFQAHQIILKCVSPVFERMLAAGMTETITGRIVIEDLDVETVQGMLNYIYSGEFKPKSDESLVCLTYCAEKYALIDLKRLCFEEMASRLSVENATAFITVVSKCVAETGIDEMRTKIVGFCHKHFAELSVLPEFKNFIRGNVEVLL